MDFGIYGGPGTDPPWLPKEDCTLKMIFIFLLSLASSSPMRLYDLPAPTQHLHTHFLMELWPLK